MSYLYHFFLIYTNNMFWNKEWIILFSNTVLASLKSIGFRLSYWYSSTPTPCKYRNVTGAPGIQTLSDILLLKVYIVCLHDSVAYQARSQLSPTEGQDPHLSYFGPWSSLILRKSYQKRQNGWFYKIFVFFVPIFFFRGENFAPPPPACYATVAC